MRRQRGRDGGYRRRKREVLPGCQEPRSGRALRLRQEREGSGVGRVYLIVDSAIDASGNVGKNCQAVVVPHSQNAADIGQTIFTKRLSFDVEAFCKESQGDPGVTCDTQRPPGANTVKPHLQEERDEEPI